MTALATGHSTLINYVRRCAILTAINAISDVTTLAFMVIFINKAPIPLLAIVYVSVIFPVHLTITVCPHYPDNTTLFIFINSTF